MFDQFFGEGRAKRISQGIVVVLTFLSLFLLVKVIADFKRLPSVGKEVYPQSTIMVSGNGEVYAIPDIATFDFSVVETASTVKDAQDKVNVKINKALASVRESGIDDKDIQTTGYNVYPKYEYSNAVCPTRAVAPAVANPDGSVSASSGVAVYCPPGKQVLTGYEVNQNITVKVRDTSKAADLVTKVGAVGVSNISGLQFSVDNREQYVAEARAKAITEAKAKAKELAKQLGVRLGDIISYNENGSNPYYGYGAGAKDVSISSVAPMVAELPTGQNKITSNVSITYEIK